MREIVWATLADMSVEASMGRRPMGGTEFAVVHVMHIQIDGDRVRERHDFQEAPLHDPDFSEWSEWQDTWEPKA